MAEDFTYAPPHAHPGAPPLEGDDAVAAWAADTWGPHDGCELPAPELCDACDAWVEIVAPSVARPRVWRRITVHEDGCPSYAQRQALERAAGQAPGEPPRCGRARRDGKPCRSTVDNPGDACHWHADRQLALPFPTCPDQETTP